MMGDAGGLLPEARAATLLPRLLGTPPEPPDARSPGFRGSTGGIPAGGYTIGGWFVERGTHETVLPAIRIAKPGSRFLTLLAGLFGRFQPRP